MNSTEYPLAISFTDVSNELHMMLMYNASKYDAAYITLISAYLDACLIWIVESTLDTLVESMWQLPPGEYSAIVTWSQGEEKTLDPACQLLPDLFLNSVSRTPTAIALECGNDEWTYAQVHQQALIIAQWLIAHQVQPGDRVALVFTRSPYFVFAVLAVLLVGGVYTPIEATVATERICSILEELGKPAVLLESYNETLTHALPPVVTQVGYCDAIFTQNSCSYSRALPPPRQPRDLAYIIFTSGTMGQPKGVQVRHESAVNALIHVAQTMELDANCRFLQLLNIAFDASLNEMFPTFYAGGTVVLSQDIFLDDLPHVNTCALTPSLLVTVNPREFPGLAKVICGGEALSWAVACDWAKGHQLFQAYGPTEVTVGSHLEPVCSAINISLGGLTPNMQCYILDSQCRAVPIGIMGEICIAGMGVSNGYLNRPDLTAKAFVPNPFGSGQMYLTGDLGCWLPNGKIKYLGRKDFQVKLRGFRIELDEIESTAQTLDAVNMCAAIAKNKQLVLYVAPIDVDQTRLREVLVAKLPAYMVPEHIIAIEQLPLTRIGKIDRRALQALPLPEISMENAVDSSDYSPIFVVLRDTLAEVLTIDSNRIQPTSSFFRLGGDSISAIQLVTRGKRRGVTMTVAQVLKYPILAQLEQHVELLSEVSVPELTVADDPVGPLPLTAIQRWFMYDTGHGNMDHFNQSFALKGRELLTMTQLRGALLTLINHHDVLRTRFIRHTETREWQAQVLPVTNALDTHVHLEAATVSHGELGNKILDLQTRLSVDCALNVAGGLLNVDGTQVLFLAVHHLVVDLVSWRILLEDLEALLTGQSLPPKTLSFRQWAHQVNGYAQTLPSDQWPDYGPVNPLPLDHVVSADHVPTYASCQTAASSIGLQATAQLFGDAAAVAHAQPQDFMLAALAMALQSVLGAAPFEVDLESHGRYPWSDQQDISRTVGWFTSLYPVPLHLPSTDSTSTNYDFDVLRHVKHRIRAMPSHGFPYGLRKYCQANTTATDAHTVSSSQLTHPRQHVVFNYVGRFDQLAQANAFWQECPLPWSHDFSLQEPFNQAFLVTCSLDPDHGLTMSLMYSTDLHTSATAQRIADQWCTSLQSLVAYTVQYAQPCWAPCDFELLSLTESQLDQLIHQDLVTLRITPAEVEAIYPCLPLQEGMVSALVHDPIAYSVQTVMTVRGALDIAKFQQAWNSVVDRHPILRTRFLVQPHCQAATTLQVVTKALVPKWTIGTELAEQTYLAADFARGFDAEGPLLRFALFSVNAQVHHFVLTMHHALFDGWSLSLLLTDVLTHYTNMIILPVPGRYQDVVQYYMAQDPSTALAFWRTELEAIMAPCHLPSPHCTALDMATKQFTPEYFSSATLTLDNLAAISQFAQQHSITLSTLLRAVVAILLQYYTGNDHVLFGITLSGRNLPVGQIEQVVGPCINTVPCHAHLATDTTVWALLDQLQQSSVQVMPYEHCSLADIHRCTSVDPGQALFNTLLVYENYPQATPDPACPIVFVYEHVEQNTEYPLTILAGTDADQLSMLFMYRTDIFPQAYMEQVVTHCERIVISIVASTSDTLVSQVDPLSAAERQLLLTTFATNPHPYPVGYAHQHFMDQVSQRPGAIAVRTTESAYTYRQLSFMAHALAAQLFQAAPTIPDHIVAIVADSSVELIVGQLAVWLTGCAFVVIDPRYPLERKRFILSDARCVAVLGHTADLCDIPTTQPTIALDTLDASADQPAAFTPVTPAPTDLAWLIYTSGSTGQPKGVMVEHGSAVCHFQGAGQMLQLTPDTVTPTMFTPTFDASISEIWTTLSYGGSVLIVGRDKLWAFSQVERVCCTPSLLAMLNPTDYPTLKCVTIGGEAVTQKVVDTWTPHITLINWYGPTEITVVSHYAYLKEGDVPVIGKPLPNVSGYILDALLRPVPVGVVGELHIGGPGVARGYLNQPELTAEKFIDNPFGPGRLFKSGDLARWLPDGNIRCLGRRDNQVKVHGYRIELDEVTNILAQFKGVQQASVVVQDNQLIGYVAPQDTNTQDIIAFTKTLLPYYMVPAAIVQLDTLPLTPIGKIDRKALPKHTFASQPTDACTIPRTAIEDQLIRIVALVLNIPQKTISFQDTFFQLGGDSLSAIRLSALCRDQGLRLTIPRLFERPMLSDIVEYALEVGDVSRGVIEKEALSFALLNQSSDALEHTLGALAHQLNLPHTAIEDVLPTSSLQEGFVINTLKDPSAYMVQQAFELTGDLDVNRYQSAWRAVCQHHAILRTKFAVTDQVVPYSSLQVVTKHAGIAWHYDTCPGIEHSNVAAFKQAWLARDRAQGFHLDGSPLVRLTLVAMEPNLHLLFWSLHHALLDMWSVGLVLDQVLAVYHGQSLPPTLPYSAFIHHVAAQDPEACKVFWQTTLEGVKPTPAIQLPSTTSVRDSMETHATHNHTISTPSATILQFCQQQSITLNTLICAVWAIVLARYLDERDEVTFGTLVSGRNVPLAGIDQMVGLTTNTVPLRAKLDLDAPIHTWLATLHAQFTALMAYEHASLVDIMHWAHTTPEQPLFDTLLVHTPVHETTQPQYELAIHQVESGGFNTTEYPLVASFGQDGERVVVSLQYACAKYDSAYIGYLAGYVNHCMTGMVNCTDATLLASLLSLPPIESQKIEQWAHGEDCVLDPTIQYLDELFTRNLSQRPDATALESGNQRWTYAEVYQHAVVIANRLQEHGVIHETKVALAFTRSPYFVFSLLAVLLLGAVYIPIDVAHGIERICGILDDLGHPIIVTSSLHAGVIEGHMTNSHILCVDQLQLEPKPPLQPSHFNSHRSPTDLAYIVFTSGTTGKPKGVQVRHESAVNILIYFAKIMGLDSSCRCLQLLNIAFDAFLNEVFSTFYAGGTLVLLQADISIDLHKVNSCLITPSLLAALEPQDYPKLRVIGCGGEALPWSMAAQWQPNRTLVNIYGPTETTICSHIDLIDLAECITLGKPVPNTQCYVLDPLRRPVPIGVAGEICITGLGVSNGYFNQPELTTHSFIDNPFGPGQMYLTGDLGCWLPNGKIKYLGRMDFQVKLRGFRIELGEVEQAIMKHPSVSAACAIAQDGNLVALVTPAACDPQAITQLISQSLPPYMIPAIIVPLDALPLTCTGKTDRKALPRVNIDKLNHQEIVRPQTPMEIALVGILTEVLRLNDDQISTRSTFFQLGGNSLTAIRLVAKCQQQGFALAMTDINRTHTIAQLAQRMESQSAMADCEPYPNDSGPVRLTPIQREFLTEGFQWPQAYLSPLILQCNTAFAFSIWQSVVAQLLSYHDMLRFHLADKRDSSGAPMGVIEPSLDASQVLDISEADTDADLHSVAVEACAKVDYRTGPICQFRVINMHQQQFFLSVVHHLAFDLVSSTILLDDIVSLLQGQPLPPKTLSYTEWSDTLHAIAQSLDVSTITLPTPSPPLPLDYPHIPLNRSKEYEAKEILTIDDELLHRFSAYTQQHTATAVDLLMTALLLACYECFNVPSITMVFESNGRSPPGQSFNVSRTLGWCVSHHYLSLSKQASESPHTTLERTQSILRDLSTNGFHLFLAKHLKVFSDPNERAQFNINPKLAFSYLDDQTLNAARSVLPIVPHHDLLKSIMSQLLPNAHPYPLVVSCQHAAAQLEIEYTFHTNQFHASTLQRFAASMRQALSALVM